jgi:hypothetical protein
MVKRRLFPKEALTKKWKRYPLQQMYKSQCRDTKNMKKQGNLTIPKVHNSLENDPKDTEMEEMPDK